MPMMLASIHQLPAASLGDGSTATITLIARRAVHRVGTRHWRRGADPEVLRGNGPLSLRLREPCLHASALHCRLQLQQFAVLFAARQQNVRRIKGLRCIMHSGSVVTFMSAAFGRAMSRTSLRRSSWWRWRAPRALRCQATCRCAAALSAVQTDFSLRPDCSPCDATVSTHHTWCAEAPYSHSRMLCRSAARSPSCGARSRT